MENQVAEVAISFDKPYPYEEVRKMLPSNVNLVWLYVYSKRLMKRGSFWYAALWFSIKHGRSK